MKLLGSKITWIVPWIVVGIIGCGGSSKKDGPTLQKIKIVSSMPRVGSAQAQTTTIVNGIQLALEEVDHKVGDFQIEYEDWDDANVSQGKWTVEAETRNADQAVQDPDVMVYIGTYNSGAAQISMPKLNQADLLMVSPANTSPGLTKPGLGEPDEPDRYRPTGRINYVRIPPTDDLQGKLSADWAKSMSLKRVFVLDDTEVYGRGIAQIFAQRCDEIGLEVLDHQSIDVNNNEFKALATTIKDKNPDLVYFGGTSQTKAPQIAKDLVAVGLNCKLMAPDGCFENAFIEAAGAENLNDRCYVTFGGLPPEELTDKGAEFVKRYRQKYGENPEAYAVYGYEAAKLALEAIRAAGKKDRRAICDAALAIKDFKDGALGTWSIDENGDSTLQTLSGNVVRDGKFTFVKRLGE